jgi:hypothetical protein
MRSRATRIQELEQTIAIVDAAVASGEVDADRSVVRLVRAEWAADLAQLRESEAEEQRELAAALADAGVIRHGVQRSEDDDGYTRWYVIRRGTIGWYPVLERRLGVAMQPTRCHSGDWDCCGRFFSDGARVRVQGDRILVAASYSRDV